MSGHHSGQIHNSVSGQPASSRAALVIHSASSPNAGSLVGIPLTSDETLPGSIANRQSVLSTPPAILLPLINTRYSPGPIEDYREYVCWVL